jgi:hypothetical protein
MVTLPSRIVSTNFGTCSHQSSVPNFMHIYHHHDHHHNHLHPGVKWPHNSKALFQNPPTSRYLPSFLSHVKGAHLNAQTHHQAFTLKKYSSICTLRNGFGQHRLLYCRRFWPLSSNAAQYMTSSGRQSKHIIQNPVFCVFQTASHSTSLCMFITPGLANRRRLQFLMCDQEWTTEPNRRIRSTISYLGVPGFKSRPADFSSWLSSVPPGNCHDNYAKCRFLHHEWSRSNTQTHCCSANMGNVNKSKRLITLNTTKTHGKCKFSSMHS